MHASLSNKSFANITLILRWLTNYKKFKSCVNQGRGLPATQAGTQPAKCQSVQSPVGACSVTSLCDPMNCSPPGSCPRKFPGKNTGVGCHFLLQGIFPTQGLNMHLLLGSQILYRWATLKLDHEDSHLCSECGPLCGSGQGSL